VMISAWHAKGMDKAWIRIAAVIITVLISLSTVFLKQHSAVDVLMAIPVCMAAYYAAYGIHQKQSQKL